MRLGSFAALREPTRALWSLTLTLIELQRQRQEMPPTLFIQLFALSHLHYRFSEQVRDL